MAATTPLLNGTQLTPSPPQSPLPSTAKRKRAEAERQPRSPTVSPIAKLTNGDLVDDHKDVGAQDVVQNIWKVLESHDTFPSILQRSIHIRSPRSTIGIDEQTSKRTKLTATAVSQTITERVKSGFYTSTGQFKNDVDAVCRELVAEAQIRTLGETASSDSRQDRLIAETNAFQAYMASLVQREVSRQRTVSQSRNGGSGKWSIEKSQTNGVRKNDDTEEPEADDSNSAKTVLTLFGNAQGHKQLFSSFQRAYPSLKDETKCVARALEETSIVSRMPLRESGLPNGISSTKILSTPSDDIATRSKSRTFAETFPPPSSFPPLIPPKTPRQSTTRQTSITWAPNPTSAPRNSLIHAQQRLLTGHWLGYNGISPMQEPSSPEVLRKQRDRALSTGETGGTPSAATIAAQTQAKEEALFRSLYSSFAPCRDNSLAIVPEEIKSQVWWQRTGHAHLDRLIAPATSARNSELAVQESAADDDDEEEVFRDAVIDFQSQPYDSKQESGEGLATDKTGDELLNDVSELLAMLHSYQRIRNSSLNATARPSVRQISGLHNMIGTPSMPSGAEIETYNTLKAQLVQIVSIMPPHAVAKLNGEQLDELNISTRMQLEEQTYRGVMEEDQAYRAAKTATQIAIPGSLSAQSRTSAVSTPSSLLPGQARTAQMSAQSRQAVPPQYYGGAPPSLSRHASSFSRTPLSAWQTPPQSYGAAGSSRPSFTSQQSFGQQNPSQASGSGRAHLQQTGSGRPGNQQSNGLYSTNTPSQPAYQQRAQNYAASNASFTLKSPYNTAQQQNASNKTSFGSPQVAQSNYSRPSYQLSRPAQTSHPTSAARSPQAVTSDRLNSLTAAVITGNVSELLTGRSMPMKQSQSPAPPALSAGFNSANGTPQPKQEGQPE